MERLRRCGNLTNVLSNVAPGAIYLDLLIN